MIRLRTLGSLEIQDGNGDEVESLLAQSRRVALLVYLALATPRGFHRRDTLLALFWPDQDDAHARNALSQSVHVLRRALGATAIISRADDELALDWKEFWCDAIAFESALDAGRLAEALDLYRGPLLDGFHVSNGAVELNRWIEQQRERYTRRCGQALERMAEMHEMAGDFAAAVPLRRRLAALDPLSSRAALGLMRALAASGEPAQAVQHARVHESLLREELETTPDPAVTALARELAAPRAATPEPPPAPTTKPLAEQRFADATPLVDEPPGATGIGWYRRGARALGAAAVLGVFVVAVAGSIARSHARTASGIPAVSCLAVLPLANLTGDVTQEYLADGVTDAIITELARFDRPTVISHTSTSRYRKTRQSIPEIARDLSCDGIVEGTLTRAGARVHVAARLVHAPTDRQLWSESYERDLTDLIMLERQIAEAVAGQVRAVATAADARSPPSRRQVDPQTYAMYLRGRDAFMSRNPATLRLALALFQQTVIRDTAFALGYAGLSDTYRMLGGLGYAPRSFYADSAEPLARRALALDSMLSEAHNSLAARLTDQANWPAAEAEFRRAIALQPGNALAHHWYAFLLATLDRKEEAVREIRRAVELDPLSQAAQGSKLMIESYAGLRGNQQRPGNRRMLVDPTHPGTAAARSINLARAKRCPEAYAENRNAQTLAPGVTMIQLSLVGVHLLCGAPRKARALLDTLEKRPDARLQAVYIANLFVARQEPDSAFAWLMNGEWGMQGRMELRTAPSLNPIRSDPRFAQVLRTASLR